nr:UPF0538 protein C2orf76 homolog isoform X3 [Odocoileus virginianus texanus]
MRTSPASLVTERIFPQENRGPATVALGQLPGLVASEAAKRFRPHRASEEFSLCTHVRDSQEYLHMNDIAGLKGKDTGVGYHAFLQGIFPTHGWNPESLSSLASSGPNETAGAAHQSGNVCIPTPPRTPTLLGRCSSSAPCQSSACQNISDCG